MSLFETRKQMVIDRAREAFSKYEARHPGQKIPPVDIRFDLRGRAAGMAGRRGFNYYMRFNRDMMLNEGWDHLYKDTIFHECAHIICFANGSDRGHGYYWRATCIELGGSGERCHTQAVVFAKGRTYVYTTATGHTVHVSEVKHRRIQAGAAYISRTAGRIDRACSYSLLGSDQQIKPATKAVPVAALIPPAPIVAMGKPVQVVIAAGGSKAEQVRARIRSAKAAGESQAVVMAWAVATLGMNGGMAKKYVTENWARV